MLNVLDSNEIQSVLLSEEQIKEIVARLGKEITEDYKDKNLLVVSVLKGSVMIMADLLREIKVPCRIDFMSVPLWPRLLPAKEHTERRGR